MAGGKEHVQSRNADPHLQSNGMVEHLNRTICQYLYMFVDEDQKYCYKIHESIGYNWFYSPSKSITGRKLKLPCVLLGIPPQENKVDTHQEIIEAIKKRLGKVHEFTRHSLQVTNK